MTVLEPGEPFEGTPSEAARAGVCPGCMGVRFVNRAVPVEGTYICATCDGSGSWPPSRPVALPDEAS